MKLPKKLSLLIFPPKCVLCRRILKKEETDLCHSCRRDTETCKSTNVSLPHLAQWTSLWYYEENVSRSILRFKFHRARSYAQSYGRLLAMHILSEDMDFDVLTWVPISTLRKWRRGYDQGEQLALAVGNELGITPVKCLKKHRNNPPQAGLGQAPQRRANVLGVYHCIQPELVRGKRVLILDDVITTGATAGECARVLLTAGAKAVLCATVAAASHKRKNSR